MTKKYRVTFSLHIMHLDNSTNEILKSVLAELDYRLEDEFESAHYLFVKSLVLTKREFDESIEKENNLIYNALTQNNVYPNSVDMHPKVFGQVETKRNREKVPVTMSGAIHYTDEEQLEKLRKMTTYLGYSEKSTDFNSFQFARTIELEKEEVEWCYKKEQSLIWNLLEREQIEPWYFLLFSEYSENAQ